MIKTNKLFKQVSSIILLILFGLSNVFLQPQVKAVDLTEYEVIALVDESGSATQVKIATVFLKLDTTIYYCKQKNIKFNNTTYPRNTHGRHTAVKPTLYIICDSNFCVPDIGTNSCLYLLTPDTQNSENVKKLPRDRVFNTIYNLEDEIKQLNDKTSKKAYPEKLQKILETALRFEYNKERGCTLRDQEEEYLNLPPLPWHSTPSGKLGLGLTGTCLLSLGAALVYKTYNYVKTNNNKKLQN